MYSYTKKIIFIGGWYYMMGRGPHWARCFRRDGYHVTVLGDISAQVIASNAFNIKKIKRIVRETLIGVHKAYAVPVVPFPRFRFSRQLSAFIFERVSLPWFMPGQSDENTIIWVFRPTRAFDFRKYPRKKLVLDIPDDSTGLLKDGTAKEEIRRIEERQAREADVVFTSASSLYERFKDFNESTFLVRNAVDYDFFSHTIEPSAIPADIHAMIARCEVARVVGYQGAISNWFDFDLVEQLIKRFPNYTFAFLGPVSPQVEAVFNQKIRRYPNVYYWGMQPYEWMPFFLRQFDVGLIPFVLSELTIAVNPLKLYEYLACEVPVISVALPEVERHTEPDVVVAAPTPDAFGDAVESMITSKHSQHIKLRCREIAAANSWESRYEEIKKILG